MTAEQPVTAALERVWACRNPEHAAFRSEDAPSPRREVPQDHGRPHDLAIDDAQILAELLRTEPTDDDAMRQAVETLIGSEAGRGALTRHLQDVGAIVRMAVEGGERYSGMVGSVLARTYSREG
jgi:hypothetical protein